MVSSLEQPAASSGFHGRMPVGWRWRWPIGFSPSSNRMLPMWDNTCCTFARYALRERRLAALDGLAVLRKFGSPHFVEIGRTNATDRPAPKRSADADERGRRVGY